jgi:DNA-3-methyladenine glycosylase II
VQFAKTLTRETLAAAAVNLAERDKDLANILTALGTPPMWGRRPGFVTLVRIILEQQVSLVSARSMFARLTANIQPFTPEQFIALGEPHLRSLGVTRQKASYFLALAHAMAGGELAILSRMNDDDARAALMRIKGIGPWTADIYLLMVLKRPDIWPVGDVALISAISKLKKFSARATMAEFIALGEPWRPYRSVAARMLWQYYLAGM